MHCAGCASSVSKLVAKLPAVAEVDASFGTQRLRFRGPADYAALSEVLAKGGYALGTRVTALGGVAPEDRAAVAALGGVLSVREEAETLIVEHVDDPDLLDALRAFVGTSGHVEALHDSASSHWQRESARWRLRVLVTAPLALYLMAAAMEPLRSWLPAAARPVTLQLLVATLVQFGPGLPFLRGAWTALRGGRTDMNVLIALGTLSAYGYSAFLSLRHPGQPVYFETGAMIVLLVAVGRWLEARARRATGDAVQELARLEPSTLR